MVGTPVKRPSSITTWAIFWLFLGIYNLWAGFSGISGDIGVWDLVSDPLAHGWIKMAIPTELMLNLAVLICAVFQLIAVPGLLTGKSWSYKPAIGVPIGIAIINLSLGALYASAPAEIATLININYGFIIMIGIFQFLMVYLMWKELNKPHVRSFLGLSQPQVTIQEKPLTTKKTEEKVENIFYCRYCGKENKSDAMFCEKCGKQLKEI